MERSRSELEDENESQVQEKEEQQHQRVRSDEKRNREKGQEGEEEEPPEANESLSSDNPKSGYQQKQQVSQTLEQQKLINQQQQQQAILAQRANKPGKITHRSQSSPSSLTTHKFGLRPTPSPPRLIIDHNTGDIVETYPDNQPPVYLRTYQPLEDDCEDNTLSDSLAHPYPPPLSNKRQFEQYNQLLADQYALVIGDVVGGTGGTASDIMPSSSSNSHRPQNYRPVIPPPHSGATSGKVYFAPPEPSAGHQLSQANHQYHTNQSQAFEFAERPNSGRLERGSLSGSHNSSFKRALNKLDESSKTDIAILTEPNMDSSGYNRAGRSPQEKCQLKVTTTSAAKANAMMAKQKQPRNQQQIKQLKHQSTTRGHRRCGLNTPTIEDFNLYHLCYQFRNILVCLLSCLIIYLLVVPLNLDCTLYRPTYTYISIIVSSVNLICILIFTLFWYCSGVTRTLYANLSSSAFIITTYSILVAINLALAILFFFINTCHFQKLINTKATIFMAPLPGGSNNQHHHHQQEEQLISFTGNVRFGPDELQGYPLKVPPDMALKLETLEQLEANSSPMEADHHSTRLIGSDQARMDEELTELIASLLQVRNNPQQLQQQNIRSKRDDVDDLITELSLGGKFGQHPTMAPNLNQQDQHLLNQVQNDDQHHVPQMSPIEAAWEFVKEQAQLTRRKFNQFLLNYDLRFIGALHALCAICLQYMAMKVAVIRSYFCSPVGAYA